MRVSDIQHRELRLKSGIRIVFVPISYAQTATIMAVVNAGPRYDPVGKTGLSHLVEHLKLRNTNSDQKDNLLLSDIEQIGSAPLGFTYFETNKYWINLIPEYYTKGVEFLCRILNDVEYSDEYVGKVKKTVLEEMRIVESNPEKKMWEIWAQHIFRGTNLGNGYIGDMASIQRIEKNNIQDFIYKLYTPERTTFILSGNLDNAVLDRSGKLVDRIMQPHKNQIDDGVNSYEILPSGDTIWIEKKFTQTLNVILGFRTVSVEDGKYHVFRLIQSYLNGGLSSILGQKLMMTGLVYFIHSLAVHLSDTGYFSIRFTSLPSNLNTILQVIYKELRELKAGRIDGKRLESAKKYTIFQQRLQMDSSKQVADHYARLYPFGAHKIISPVEEEAFITDIKEKDMSDTAKEFFTRERLKIAIIGNIDKNAISVDF